MGRENVPTDVNGGMSIAVQETYQRWPIELLPLNSPPLLVLRLYIRDAVISRPQMFAMTPVSRGIADCPHDPHACKSKKPMYLNMNIRRSRKLSYSTFHAVAIET